MPKKKPLEGNPEVHDELKGFDIKINEFGEIVSNFDVDKINDFLDENVEDKKFKDLEEGQVKRTDQNEEE